MGIELMWPREKQDLDPYHQTHEPTHSKKNNFLVKFAEHCDKDEAGTVNKLDLIQKNLPC